MAINSAKRLRVYRRDNFKCVECGTTEDLSIDHVVPKSLGGLDAESNLRTMCLPCNRKKGNYHPTWKERLFAFLFTKKDANKLRNEMLATMGSKDGLIAQSIQQQIQLLNQRIDNIKPTISELLTTRENLKMIGLENSLASYERRSRERDDKLLEYLHSLSNFLQRESEN